MAGLRGKYRSQTVLHFGNRRQAVGCPGDAGRIVLPGMRARDAEPGGETIPMRTQVGVRPKLLAFVAGVTMAAASALAIAAPPQNLAEQVQTLLLKLNADTRAERVSAAQQLRKLGPAILPHLPAPELLSSAAVREAVADVRQTLEHEQARLSLRASLVTLHGRLALPKILDELERQTGNQVRLSAKVPQPVRDRQVLIEWAERPFWEAVDDLAMRTDLELGFEAGAAGLQLMPVRDELAVPEIAVKYSGPFRAAILSVRLRPSRNRPQAAGLRVMLSLAAEPRLRLLFLKYLGRDLTCAIEGAELEPLNPVAQYEIPLGEGGRHVRLQADFRTNGALSEGALVQFGGKLVFHTAAGTETFRFTDLPRAAGIARRRGGVTVKVQEVEFPGGTPRQGRVRVGVTHDAGGPAFESHRTWIFHNEAWLEAPGGRRLSANAGFETTLQADGAVGVEYRFADLTAEPGEYAFVYKAPTLLLDAPCAFDFEKLPVRIVAPGPAVNFKP